MEKYKSVIENKLNLKNVSIKEDEVIKNLFHFSSNSINGSLLDKGDQIILLSTDGSLEVINNKKSDDKSEKQEVTKKQETENIKQEVTFKEVKLTSQGSILNIELANEYDFENNIVLKNLETNDIKLYELKKPLSQYNAGMISMACKKAKELYAGYSIINPNISDKYK
jgi:hypothetical protein